MEGQMTLGYDVVKHLPIRDLYEDLAQPGVKELGDAIANVVKVARFVLGSVDVLLQLIAATAKPLQMRGNP
jgi:hypothetical protein